MGTLLKSIYNRMMRPYRRWKFTRTGKLIAVVKIDRGDWVSITDDYRAIPMPDDTRFVSVAGEKDETDGKA